MAFGVVIQYKSLNRYFCDVDKCHISFVWIQFFGHQYHRAPVIFIFFLKSQIRVAFQKIHINPHFFYLIHILLLISFRNHQSTGDFRRKKISPGGVLSVIFGILPDIELDHIEFNSFLCRNHYFLSNHDRKFLKKIQFCRFFG